jgi:hypothetical protein
VLQKDGNALFEHLDHTEVYFPMISRTDPQAFFCAPPQAVRPKSDVIPRLFKTAHAQPVALFGNNWPSPLQAQLASKSKELQAARAEIDSLQQKLHIATNSKEKSDGEVAQLRVSGSFPPIKFEYT